MGIGEPFGFIPILYCNSNKYTHLLLALRECTMSCVSPSKIHVQGFIKGAGNWDPKNIIHLIIARLNLKFSAFLGRRDAPIPTLH